MTDTTKPKRARKRAAIEEGIDALDALRSPVLPSNDRPEAPPLTKNGEPWDGLGSPVFRSDFSEPTSPRIATVGAAVRGPGLEVLEVLAAAGVPQALWLDALAGILFSLVEMNWPMPSEGLRRATPLDSLLLSMHTFHRVARELRGDAITADFAVLCEEMTKALRVPPQVPT